MIRSHDLVDFSSDAAFAVDAEHCVVAWNIQAHELLGYAAGEVIGRRCGDILQGIYSTGEPLCTSLCTAGKCFECGQQFAAKSCLLRHKDGQFVPVGLSTLVIPLEKRGNSPDEAVAVVLLRGEESKPSEWLSSQPLRIFTLGQFGLVFGGEGLAAERWKRRQALTVLKCLVTRVGRPVHREQLIEYLWPGVEMNRGWERLRVAVSFLRNRLRSAGLRLQAVETIEQSYRLRREAVWIDADVFEKLAFAAHELVHQKRLPDALQYFEDARRLYRGDFLDDEPYSDWFAEERERLRELYLGMLAKMASCLAAMGEFERAVQVCHDGFRHDPYRESFLHSLLEYLSRLDRIDWAQSSLDNWQRILAEEFGVELAHEHYLAFQQLVDARIKSGSGRDGGDEFPQISAYGSE